MAWPSRALSGLAALSLAACGLLQSFDGYSDEWGKDAGTGGSGGTSLGGFGGASFGGASFGGSGGALDAAAECAVGTTPCAAGCVDVASDRNNCGACGARCEDTRGPLAVCSGGGCICPVGTDQCGSLCTRLESDPQNCGTCGNVVDAAKWCVAGAETCRPGTGICDPWDYQGSTVDCDFACTDHKGDGSHCINAAGTTYRCYQGGQTGRCVNGTCTTAPCPSGRIECPSTLSSVKSCFDPLRDSNHCGGCLQQCAPNELCAQGQCVGYSVVEACSECGSGKTCCDPTPGWVHAIVCVSGSTCPN